MKVKSYGIELVGQDSQLIIKIPLNQEQLSLYADHMKTQGDLEDLLEIKEKITLEEDTELNQDLEQVEAPTTIGQYVELGDGTGKLDGEEMLKAPSVLDKEKDKEIENEDIAGNGYLPNTFFAKFKGGLLKDKKGGVLGEQELFDKLDHLVSTFELPELETYYNRSGQDQALTKYQASLNYLVALASGLGEGKALSHAFAARYSLLPKRIHSEGQLWFPELEKESSKLKIFEKLHKLFFEDIKDNKGKLIHPPYFRRNAEKVGNELHVSYWVIPGNAKIGDNRKELDKKYTPFLEDVSKLITYINDNPNDDTLAEDKRANMVEAVDLFGQWVLPSHFKLKDYPDSMNPHTVESGIEFLKAYGGSYVAIADVIKKICYDHK